MQGALLYVCGLLVDVHVREVFHRGMMRNVVAHEYGARCGGGRWLLSIVLILTSITNGSGEYGDV